MSPQSQDSDGLPLLLADVLLRVVEDPYPEKISFLSPPHFPSPTPGVSTLNHLVFYFFSDFLFLFFFRVKFNMNCGETRQSPI